MVGSLRWLVRWRRHADVAETGVSSAYGQPYVRRGWRYTTLQFTGEVTQSRMLTLWPDVLQVGYTRTMMACLLLRPRPRSIGIIGLGGGSQAKFCHRHLADARIEAVESHPGVLALRDAFRIPADGGRFAAVLDDGARLLKQRRNGYDMLLVDAYDMHGLPATMSSQTFYDDCRDALAEGGAMAINLYATDMRRHLARLRRSFDGHVLVLDEPQMSNRVAFAWRDGRPQGELQDALALLPRPARRQLASSFARLATARERWRGGAG
jgi:spermidine synthase